MSGVEAVAPDPLRRTIVVIGAGYGGLRLFSESLDLCVSARMADAVRFVFVDERSLAEYGRGVAWASDQNTNMRANMHSPEITIDPVTRDTVANILGTSYDRVATASELFEQRTKVGEILATQFQATLQRAKKFHVPFIAVEDQAVDIERKGITYEVTLKSGRKLLGDYVVLALGHIPSTAYSSLFNSPNYVRNPWTGIKSVKALTKKGSIAVLGLGPTAVDTIIKLRDEGAADLRAYSRTGSMQYPRPIPRPFDPKVVTQSNIARIGADMGGLRLRVLMGMVVSEFIIQEVDWRPFVKAVENSTEHPATSLSKGYAECRQHSDWFGLAASLTSSIPIAWRYLVDEDRDAFRQFHRRISNVLYGMAPSHALRMLTELEDKKLVVVGGLVDVNFDERKKRFLISYDEKAGVQTDEVDVVIDCTGFGTDLTRSETPLISNLLARKVLRPHAFGGAEVDFETGQVGEVAGRSMEIYCLAGSLNIGTRFVTNGLGHVASSAQRTAKAIHSRLGATN